MNSNTRYTHLSTQLLEARRLQEEAEASVKTFTNARFYRLRGVVLSVLSKKFGTHPYGAMTLVNKVLGGSFAWYDFPIVKELKEEGLLLTNREGTSEALMPRAIFHMSDRDLAKLVRQRVYAYKRALKDAEIATFEATQRKELLAADDKIAQSKRELKQAEKLREELALKQTQDAARLESKAEARKRYEEGKSSKS